VTNDTDSFVQEVDETLRQERLMTMLKRYGPWLAGAFAVFLAVIGGWQFWTHHSTNQSRAQADEYAAARTLLQQGDVDRARAAFEQLTTEGPGAYRTMATMDLAAILAQQGDLQAALAKFDAAAEMADDPIMRETAQLRAAYIAADTQDFQALQTRLQPLIASESRISYLARELLAIEAWEAGNLDLARTEMENLSLALNAPEVVRQRAQIALAVIGPAPAAAQGAGETPAPREGESK
jgi:hypothetical protein